MCNPLTRPGESREECIPALPRRGLLLSALSSSLLVFWFFGTTAAAQPSAETSIVRVNVTSQSYNFFRPWQKDAPTTRRALGAVLEGNRVLITAELVANASYIELEMPDTAEKVTAKVEGVDYEANLATVSPLAEGSTFLESRIPFEITTDSTAGDTLEVWQIEDTGTPVITKGDIINVEVGTYFLDSSLFLTYQLRGPLQYQSGSFTLPVVKDRKLAGLLLGYNSGDQISTILAAPIIEHFLKELENDTYPGFPSLGVGYSQTLDEQLRGYVGLDKDQGGVYVTKVVPGSSAHDAGVEKGDVLLEIAGCKIDARGNYDDPLYGKIHLSHIVRGNSYVGDKVSMKVLREGKIKNLTSVLKYKEAEAYLIDPYMFDRGPRFLIVGGLVFQELTQPYLEAWGDKWQIQAPFKLIHASAFPEHYEEEGRRKLVFLSRVMRTPTTLGYEGLSHLIVTSVNGRTINDLADLEAAFADPVDGIHRIEFSEYPKVIFVDAEAAEAVNQQLEGLGISQVKRLD